MRIIGGYLKGKEVERPKTRAVRPMSGLVLEALFNTLGPIDGLKILDAYAGTGVIGIEALSRGAASVVGIELLPAVARGIRRSVLALGLVDQYRVAEGEVSEWLKTNTENLDVIVAGPPFAQLDPGVVNGLAKRLRPSGVMVFWHSSRIEPPELKLASLVKSKRYGDSTLSFYRPANL